MTGRSFLGRYPSWPVDSMTAQTAPSSKTWLEWVFREMFRAMHNQEQDNFDDVRYPEAQRNAFFADMHAWYLSFLAENAESFFAARNLLEDDASRNLFDRLILYRLLGHLHIRLPVKHRSEVPAEWKIDATGDIGMLGQLGVFSVPYAGTDVWVKCIPSNVAATFLSDQYRFNRGGVRIKAEPGDYVIDGGGCFGDTALAFAADIGVNGWVYTFDPILKHCEIMREAFQMNPGLASRISLFDVGLADTDAERDAVHSVHQSINPGARLEEGLPTRTIDSLVASGEIVRIDFLKMDIEGSELGALQGGEQSLKRWRPRLAISLYHRPEDLFSIPLWLGSLECGYRFFLNHHSIHQEETVLYATAAS
jgi:FkbM family methyltransferase